MTSRITQRRNRASIKTETLSIAV